MPKKTSDPIILEELLAIEVASIYKRVRTERSFTLTWSINGYRTDSVDYYLIERLDDKTLVIGFLFHRQTDLIKVSLILKASNLGIGCVPFFLCPITGRLCRKLYFINSKLKSRYGIEGSFYSSQLWSKGYRAINNSYGKLLQLRELNEDLNRPFLKSHYRGEETSTVQRIIKRINKIEETLIDQDWSCFD